MTSERFRDVLTIARGRRESASLARSLGASRMTVSRWARAGKVPGRTAAAVSAWLAGRFPGLLAGEVSYWLTGGRIPALDSAVTGASGGSLRALREEAGLNQSRAAAAAGVSRATWVRWESASGSGKASPAAAAAEERLRKRFLFTL